MGVFDEIVIRTNTAPGVDQVSLERPSGPLELGQMVAVAADSGTVFRWVPNGTNPQKLLERGGQNQSGFGIDGDNRMYYDAESVDPGDEVALWGDPLTLQLWLGDQT